MKVLLYVLIVLSLAMLGAHFMRYGNTIFVGGAVALMALLFVRKAWVARLLQVVLVLGALEWISTAYGFVQMRIAMDQPYVRMAVILGSVAAVTALSALAFQSKALRKVYRLDNQE